MKALDLSEVTESTVKNKSSQERVRIVPGAYVCEIVSVEDKPVGSISGRPDAGDYLEIKYDVSEGEYAGYYADMASRTKFWPAKFYRSYKPKALGMFKHFIHTLEASNPSLSWDLCGINDEHALEGCKIGLILKDDTYAGMDGSIKHKMKVDKIVSVDEVRSGKYNNATHNTEAVPVVIIGEDKESGDSFEKIDDDVPF